MFAQYSVPGTLAMSSNSRKLRFWLLTHKSIRNIELYHWRIQASSTIPRHGNHFPFSNNCPSTVFPFAEPSMLFRSSRTSPKDQQRGNDARRGRPMNGEMWDIRRIYPCLHIYTPMQCNTLAFSAKEREQARHKEQWCDM